MGKQKVVIKLSLADGKKRSKAMRTAVGLPGVESASIDGDKITVIGDGTDSIDLTTALRRKFGYAELVTVGSAEEKKENKAPATATAATPVIMNWPYEFNFAHPHHIVYEPVYQQHSDSCNIM